MASFVLNVVIFLLISEDIRFYIVGAYVPPNNVQAVHCLDQALRSAPKGLEMILMGDLNARL